MKKIFSLLLISLFFLSLFACGGNNLDVEDDSNMPVVQNSTPEINDLKSLEGNNIDNSKQETEQSNDELIVHQTPECSHSWEEATCTNPKTCKLCEKTEGTALEHKYVVSETVEASCMTDGKTIYICALCNESYDDIIVKTGHSYNSSVTKEPTCINNGLYTFTCSKCGNTYTEEIPQITHNYTAVITKEPSCITEGEKTFACSGCNDTYTEKIGAAGHSWTEATCTTPKTCETCGAIEGNVLGHTTVDGTCTRCGVKIEVSDVEVEEKPNSESNEDEGITYYPITADELDIRYETDYSHINTDIIILGNNEELSVEITAPYTEITKDDIQFYYDIDLLEIKMDAPQVIRNKTVFVVHVRGKTACNTELIIYTLYDILTLEEECTVFTLDINKLDSEDGQIVYVTPTGEKYHFNKACAGENAMITTYYDALICEYEPCEKCAQ